MGLQVPLALLPYGYCMSNKLSVDMAIVGTVNNIITKSRSNKGSTHYLGDIEFCFIAKVLSRSFHSFGTFVVRRLLPIYNQHLRCNDSISCNTK